MIREGFFLIRFALFLVRGILWIVYGIARFIAKPGSRIIVPLIVAFLVMYWTFTDEVNLRALDYSLESSMFSEPLLTELGLLWADHKLTGNIIVNGVLVVVFTAAYYVLSRILAVIVGTFPTINRPLTPMRRLTTGKRAITSAPVRVAVPPLRMN